MHRTINYYWVMALTVFAAHNFEEAFVIANGWAILHLPEMSWTASQWSLFAWAATALTLFVGVIAWRFRYRPARSALWLRVFLWIMLLNAIWHVGVSFYTRSFAPGVVTAVLLVLPLYSVILRKLSEKLLAPDLGQYRVDQHD